MWYNTKGENLFAKEKDMFSYIKGTLEVKALNYIVVDVNGLGFKIFMSQSAIQRLEETGTIVKIHTYMGKRSRCKICNNNVIFNYTI